MSVDTQETAGILFCAVQQDHNVASVWIDCGRYIGHISKYIAPGAKRIGWSKYGANLDVTAAVNPDGSYVVILLNRTKEDSGCFLRVNGHIMRVDLPAETLSTVVIEK
jgi:glucosylceramidase